MGWDRWAWDEGGVRWDGMGWDGTGWDGIGWDGMEWDGMKVETIYNEPRFFSASVIRSRLRGGFAPGSKRGVRLAVWGRPFRAALSPAVSVLQVGRYHHRWKIRAWGRSLRRLKHGCVGWCCNSRLFTSFLLFRCWIALVHLPLGHALPALLCLHTDGRSSEETVPTACAPHITPHTRTHRITSVVSAPLGDIIMPIPPTHSYIYKENGISTKEKGRN